METTHTFRTVGRLEGKETGLIQTDRVHAPLAFSAPEEFHGLPGFWTPEDFLLAAVASCFLTTFRAIATNSKLEIHEVRATAEGKVSHRPDGWQFTDLLLKVDATIPREKDSERTTRLIEKAERACIVSRALKVIPQLSISVTVTDGAVEDVQGSRLAGSEHQEHDSRI